MINIVLFGAPGCGKGTQAALLKEQFGFEHLSTGELIRDHIRRETPFGLEVKACIERGQLAPDEVVISMIEEYALQFGFNVRRARRIRLALEEMLFERIVNAFEDVGDIHLDFVCHRDFLRLTFRDSGQPYDFEKQRKTSDSAKIMAFAADDLSITKDKDGNNRYNLDFLFDSDSKPFHP